MVKMLQPWQGVDGVVVINMDSNPERMNTFQAKVVTHLPSVRFERLSAVAGRELDSYGKAPWFTEKTGERARFWGGTAGCALSHRNAVRLAQERGWRNILIFEDDAVLKAPELAGIVVAEALAHMDGRYLFYLGYNKPAPYGQRVASLSHCFELWKTDGVLATHAYLIPESMYAPLLKCFPENDADIWGWLSRFKAVDVFYRDFMSMLTGASVYVLSPMLCVQDVGVSDIGGASNASLDFVSGATPIPCYGIKRMLRVLLRPLKNIKTRLNSVRTRLRAQKGGLPGYKRRS